MTTTPTVEAAARQLRPAAPQATGWSLLVFRLSGERFALPVADVVEVIEPIPCTCVPQAPPHVRMLVNVRGVITPLIDLRQRLRLPSGSSTVATRFVVLDIVLGGCAQRIAFEADEVEAVQEANGAALEPMPELGSRWPPALVRGVCRDATSVLFLLNSDALFELEHVAD